MIDLSTIQIRERYILAKNPDRVLTAQAGANRCLSLPGLFQGPGWMVEFKDNKGRIHHLYEADNEPGSLGLIPDLSEWAKPSSTAPS